MDGDSRGRSPKTVAFEASNSENEKSKCSTWWDGSQGGSKQDEDEVEKFMMSDGISSKQSRTRLLSAPTIEDEYNQAWEQFDTPVPVDTILVDDAMSPDASVDRGRKNGFVESKRGECVQRSMKKVDVSTVSSRSLISGSSSVLQGPVEPAKAVHLGALEMPQPKRATRRRHWQVTPVIAESSFPVEALQETADVERLASAASQLNIDADDLKGTMHTSAASDASSLESENFERMDTLFCRRTVLSRANSETQCIPSQVAPFIRLPHASGTGERDPSLPTALNDAISVTVAGLQSMTVAARQALGDQFSTLLISPATPIPGAGDGQVVDASTSSPAARNNMEGDQPSEQECNDGYFASMMFRVVDGLS